MKKKKITIDNYRIIIDEINYYYPKDAENKDKTQTEYRVYIEFTNRERLMLKYLSSDARDNTLRMLDAEFD
ncbi:MAG: hypothetical protein FWC01_08610 [Treponema sp.]|nr:hypothetical protein [Treponema sp.]MCL2238072.1 hypothetical protein [Treponema sp.]